MSDTKVCKYCGKEKPVEEFSFLKRGEQKRRSRCRVCASVVNREYKKNNKDTVNNAQRKRRGANVEKYREMGKSAYDKNPTKFREKSSRFRLKHKDKYVGMSKEYRERIADGYCRVILRQRGLSSFQITPELITAQRSLIKLKRAIKKETTNEDK